MSFKIKNGRINFSVRVRKMNKISVANGKQTKTIIKTLNSRGR